MPDDHDGAAAAAIPSPEADEPTGTCHLDGCDNPLPPPRRDEHGRRTGGRPAKYCGPAHKDAAARARRDAAVAAEAEPLA
ncbi:hypothetical protein ACFOWE_30220, partial [Planomonospora corallina]